MFARVGKGAPQLASEERALVIEDAGRKSCCS